MKLETFVTILLISAGIAQEYSQDYLEQLCLKYPESSGFYCLPGLPASYLRCHIPEQVSTIMPCPALTVCTLPLLVFSEETPCTLNISQKLCGNGIVEESEQCEIGGQGCDTSCMCIPGYVPASPASKDCILKQRCGNGVVEQGEQCEIGGFGCDQECQCFLGFVPAEPPARDCLSLPACGNGVVEDGEECEVGGIGCTTRCRCSTGFIPKSPTERDCKVQITVPFCGDGIVQAQLGEECEVGGVGCTSQCQCLSGYVPVLPPTRDCVVVPPQCGNGDIDADEECEIGGVGCSAMCECLPGYTAASPVAKDCMPIPVCGNGLVEAGEECEVGGYGCNSQCQCSPGFTVTVPVSRSCVMITTLPFCGDGVVDSSEECEIGGLGCGANCTCLPTFEPAEPRARDCVMLPACGNGVVETAVGEQCEIGGYGCSAECLCAPGFNPASPIARDCVLVVIVGPVCGNGIVEGTEQCEVGGLGCSSECRCIAPQFVQYSPAQISCEYVGPICGDGVVEGTEECEIGGIGCTTQCTCDISAGYAPASPIARDCAEIATQPPVIPPLPSNLTALCEQIDSGFICLPGRPAEYLRCHLLEEVAFIMSCPAGTLCAFDPLVPAIDNPCIKLDSTVPVDVPAGLCGNGELNAGEECEVGGAGCGLDCKCVAGFMPRYPTQQDCIAVSSLTDIEAVCATAGAAADGLFFCPALLEGQEFEGITQRTIVQCISGSAVVLTCAPGLLCTAEGFVAVNPCNFTAPRCGNGVLEDMEECEISGEGCDSVTCTCLPGYVPTQPAPAVDCVPEFISGGPGSLTNLSGVCSAANIPGFFCPARLFAGNETALAALNVTNATFAQCGAGGVLAGLQECPWPLECLAEQFTQHTPCGIRPRCGDGILQESEGEECEAPGFGCNVTTCKCLPGYTVVQGSISCRQTFAPVCGNGVVEQNETCEVTGVGCNSTTCQCIENYTRMYPASRDCVKLPLVLESGANATQVCLDIGRDLPTFGACVAGQPEWFLLCDPAASSSMMVRCPPGTACSLGSLAPMPCVAA